VIVWYDFHAKEDAQKALMDRLIERYGKARGSDRRRRNDGRPDVAITDTNMYWIVNERLEVEFNSAVWYDLTRVLPDGRYPCAQVTGTVRYWDDVAYRESYYKTDGKGKIKSYEGKATDIVIPSRINGIPITAIGESAFINKSLTSVTIPAGVMSIESCAFCNNYLTKVEIPSSVTIIGSEAFENNQLTSITIPKGVTIIEDTTFHMNRLSNVVIPYNVTSIGHYAFARNKLTSVVIPDGVKSIGFGAFSENELTSITIPAGVTSISSGAFRNNRLTSVTIGKGVTSIEEETFQGNQLNSITIPAGVTSIGRAAFSSNNLTSITIGANVKLGFKSPNNDIWPSFDNDFDDFYNKNGKKAGTYVYSNNRWIMK